MKSEIDVLAANDKQAQYMLAELKQLFDDQNRKLDRILELLEVDNENNKRDHGTNA